MKKLLFVTALLILLVVGSLAFSDPARFLDEDKNQSYHYKHLLLHVGSQNCKVSGDFIKIREAVGSNKVLGHLEQSDTFTLNSMNGSWASITVTYSAKSSPDSYIGLTGWVDSDYVECPCSYNEYYYGPVHTVFSYAVTLQSKTNLREEARKDSVSLAKINQGEQVEILSEYIGKDDKSWYRVRYGKQVGFIRSDLVNVTETGMPEANEQVLAKEDNDAEKVTTSTPLVLPFSENTWQEAYRAFILDKEYERIGYPDYLLDGYDAIAMTDGSVRLQYVGYDYDPIWFSLYDLDNDQTPELLVFNGMGYMAGNFCHVYTFKEHAMYHVGELGRRELFLAYGSDKRFPGLVQTDGNMGYYTTDYWYIQNNDILIETIESIHDGPYLDEDEFEGNNGEAVVTRETSDDELYDWYHDASFSSLPHWDYNEINEKGWDRFVSAMLQQSSLMTPEAADTPSADTCADQTQTPEQPTHNTVDCGFANEDILFVSEGYYYVDNFNTDDCYSFIPVDVYCNKEIYRANEPITFSADILGGTGPFSVHWSVEESQTRDAPTPLDLYISSHEDHTSSVSYTTSSRHVEFVYTPPVESTTLFGCFSVTDSKGISNYSPNEDLAFVDTFADWRDSYPRVSKSEDESFPFAARTNRNNVNVRNGIGKDQEIITVLSTFGSLVKVVGKGYDSSGNKWYIVRFEVGKRGYIQSDCLTIE